MNVKFSHFFLTQKVINNSLIKKNILYILDYRTRFLKVWSISNLIYASLHVSFIFKYIVLFTRTFSSIKNPKDTGFVVRYPTSSNVANYLSRFIRTNF